MSNTFSRNLCAHRSDFARNRMTYVVTAAAGLLCATASHAQTTAVQGAGSDQSPREIDKEVIEEVLVTGSHIRRAGFEGRAPVQVLGAERLEVSGVSQLQEALRDLTVNTGSQLVNEQNTRAGVSQFSLRGLGLGSTLTLVNGRRAGVAPVADATGTDFLDINQFPVAMIERIEVLTDGASATYGSEAVAGVVNIITRSNFEGFELSGDFRDATNEAYAANLALGSDYESGHFAVFASYYGQTRNHRTDFPWLVDRIHGGGDLQLSNLISGQGAPGSYRRAVLNASGQPERLTGAVNFADPDCEAAGGVFSRNAATGVVDRSTCRFDFADQRAVIAEEQRTQVFTQLRHEFSEQLDLFSELSYSKNTIKDTLGGFTYANGAVVGGDIYVPANHPFNFFVQDPANPMGLQYIPPSQWQPGVNQAVDLACICRPLGKEVNGDNRTGDIVRDFRYVRMLGGVDLDLFDDWSATLHHSYASGRIVETTPHNYNADVFNQLVASGQWNPFGTRLSNPDLQTPKDRMLDGLNPSAALTAGNSPDVLQQFDGTSVSSAVTTQRVTEGVLSGELFRLGSGAVSAAVGAQYRQLSLTDDPDSLEAAGEGNEPFQQFTIKGAQDAWAAFAETIVPLGSAVELQFAGRHEDYGGSVGSTTDPKVSAEVRPLDWFAVRGSWGTSFQAPTIRQIKGTTANASLNDPATVVAGQLVCLPPGSVGAAQNVIVRVEGSDDLQPQSAENFSAGIVLRPFGGRLNFSVDYWDYSYDDLIAQESSPQAIVNADCTTDGIPNNDPRITRNAAGLLRVVRDQVVNVGEVQTNGVDLALLYSVDAGAFGTLGFDAQATYVNKFDVIRATGAAPEDRAGSRNSTNGFAPTPEWRANAGVSWTKGIHSANVTGRYIDSYGNDQNTSALFGVPEIESFTTLDVQYQIAFSGLIDDEETVIAIGANNVLDEDPPALTRFDGSGNLLETGTRPSYDGEVHDLRGRIVYVRFKQSF